MNFRYALLTGCSLTLAAASYAAGPEVVGTWAGSLKTKVGTPSGIASVKRAMKLEIAADDSTTVTLDGTVQASALAGFSVGEVLFVYGDTSVAPNMNINYAVAHVKGTKAKGATSGVTVSGSSELLETISGKFSLKKQN